MEMLFFLMNFITKRAIREKKVSDLKGFLLNRGLLNTTIIADTNMWNPDAFDLAQQEFAAAYYLNVGIRLIKVSKNVSRNAVNNKGYRVACNEAIYSALDYKLESGNIIKQPRLKVYERCSWFIETFPALITNINDDEDIADGQNDHAYDAAKYLFMALMKPAAVKFNQVVPKWLEELNHPEKLQLEGELVKNKPTTDFMGV